MDNNYERAKRCIIALESRVSDVEFALLSLMAVLKDPNKHHFLPAFIVELERDLLESREKFGDKLKGITERKSSG